MLQKFFCLALVCAFSALSFFASAQSDTARVRNYSLKFSPQHLILNGVHLDLEKRLEPHGYHSLILSPRFYYGNTQNIDGLSRRSNEEKDWGEVSGYGAAVQYRVYLTRPAKPTGEQFYTSFGINCHHFKIDFVRQGWVEETADDGLLYYRYKDRSFTEKVDRWGGVILLGAQDPVISDRVVLDAYVGLGYKSSSIETDYTEPRYNYNLLDFGFTGAHLLLGMKLGIAF
ncbi:hypothetical protein LN893_05340 [Pontibacter sp. XAAS-A31]|nr:hypothetical protein [Pontibacter harenae]